MVKIGKPHTEDDPHPHGRKSDTKGLKLDPSSSTHPGESETTADDTNGTHNEGKSEGLKKAVLGAFSKKFGVGGEEDEILTYAQTLHKALNIMWFPMVLMGRLPFSLVLRKNQAIIEVTKTSFPYIFCAVNCALIWIIFVWITAGLICLAGRLVLKNEATMNEKTSKVSVYYARRYWLDVFIVWTNLLQAVLSSTHILYQAKEFADFVKSWYHVLDSTKIEVSRTLALYIWKSLAVFMIVVLAIISLFFAPTSLKSYEAACEIMVIALGQPLTLIGNYKDNTTLYDDGEFYFQKYAPVGLIIYIIAIIFSWLYIMQFMVFCRCFRIGLKGVNQRIAMLLNVDDVQRTGPNAIRLTYDEVHKDYLGIATTGIRIGKIFSWTMCNYYLWAILVIVIELGEIFKFAKRDYKSNKNSDDDKILVDNKVDKNIPPAAEIAGDLLHFIVTTVNVFYVSYEGAGAHREGKRAYELARYKGLIDCSSQLERNFIRSIWIVVSDKVPVHVSPGKYFGVTNSTVLTVFVTAFTYFIFWVQSLGQLDTIVDQGSN